MNKIKTKQKIYEKIIIRFKEENLIEMKKTKKIKLF